MTVAVPRLEDLPAPPAGRTGWPWTVAAPPLPALRPDGSPWPRISIVTPSHNQGAYLEETLRSVLLQGYPNLEYIVIDGASHDQSPDIVRRYAPWLAHWELQADRGHAAAIDSGFEQATGSVLAFLNSDDTYLPGALARAASEIEPRRGRHLVVGRCVFVDGAGQATGDEHLSRAVGHRRVLAVWKGHPMPQPATFWSRQAWQHAGPTQEAGGSAWIDYALFCRMTRRYRMHAVDQVLATYRLHPDSITVRTDRAATVEALLRISRRHWGAPWTPRHLALAAGLAAHRFDRLGRARARFRRAAERRAGARPWPALVDAVAGSLLAPGLGLGVALARLPRRTALGARTGALRRRRALAADRVRTDAWEDGWAGPLLGVELAATGDERWLRLSGIVTPRYLAGPLDLEARLEGLVMGRARIERDGRFALAFPLSGRLAAGRYRVEIAAAPHFVPDEVLGNGDNRALCWLVHGVELAP